MAGQFGCDTAAVATTKNQLLLVAAGLEALTPPHAFTTALGSAQLAAALQEFIENSSQVREKLRCCARGVHDVFDGLLKGIASVDTQLAACFTGTENAGIAPAEVGAALGPSEAVIPPLFALMGSGSVAAWWAGLTEPQRQFVITQHPEWIANLDGIPFASRDAANRARLPIEEAQLRQRQQQLLADLARMQQSLKHEGLWEKTKESLGISVFEDVKTGVDIIGTERELNKVNDKIASVDAMKKMLERPDRHVIGLDFSHDRAQAIISNGDVDTADHVAVLAPGVGTTVHQWVPVMDENMANLKSRTEKNLQRYHRPETVATVSWLGYQAPQLGTLATPNSLLTTGPAQEGGKELAEFLRGINDMRGADPHLALLGHSYGSATSGFALREDTGVDEAILFGSPGVGVGDANDLRVPPGHVFVAEAPRDPVADTWWFGHDPSDLPNAKQLYVGESEVVWEPQHEVEHNSSSEGHSEYFKDQSTSQYNMSQVLAGNTSSLFERK